MKAINYFALAAMAISIAACSNNEDEPTGNGSEPVAAKIIGNINGVNTRAYDDQWDTDDKIGISTTSNGKTQYVNMKYKRSSNSNDFAYAGDATGIFFQDTQEVTFSAYYPFSGTEGTPAGTINNVRTDDQTNQKQFDYLFASGATASRNSSTVSFTFSHKMTRLILNITAGAGVTTDNVKNGTYYLNGIKHDGTFNTETGDATATDNANNSDWKISATPTDANNTHIYSMIFYPQTNATLTFKAVINGETYGCTLNPVLDAGTSYSYDISVNKTGLTVSGTITNWDDGGSATGSAEMQ